MHRLFAGAVFRLDPGLLYTRPSMLFAQSSRKRTGIAGGIDTNRSGKTVNDLVVQYPSGLMNPGVTAAIVWITRR